jgi:DHA1 family bicyclomycin/chloramphenicol resistance-like MFS transporter
MWRESRGLLMRPVFLGYVLQAALIYSLFFVFVSIATHVMGRILGMPTDQFGIYYLFLAGGFFLGNLQVSRVHQGGSVERQMITGLALQFIGALLALTVVLLGASDPLYVFTPMALFSYGQGLTLSNVIAHGVRLAPNFTGVASSIFGFSQLALAAALVQAMGYVPVTGWQPVLWFVTVGAAITFVGVIGLRRREVSPTSA